MNTIPRRGHQKLSFISIALGTIIGIGGLALTSYDPLWDWMSVPRDLRGSLTTGFSIFTLLFGFLAAFYLQQEDAASAVARENVSLMGQMISSIPHLNLFSFHTGDEAMRLIANEFGRAHVALNTRIFHGDYNPTSNPAFASWDRSLRRGVRSGLSYKEVVSRGNCDLARERARSLRATVGSYDAVWIDYLLPSFMNFIVLEYPGGVKDVWFGWLVSQGAGFEQHVIRTTESRIVQLFEQWHRELFAHGKRIDPDPHDASSVSQPSSAIGSS
jgi:hypothetical protein